jgi:hypothetical protein
MIMAVLADKSLESTLEENIESALEKRAKAAGKSKREAEVNQKLLALLCVGNLPPNLTSLPEFQDFVHVLDPHVKLHSASSFQDKWIPHAAAKLELNQLNLKSSNELLTISYNGGTTRATKSIYTVHITTGISCSSIFYTGDEASGVSHTGEHIANLLIKVSRSCW